MHFYYRVGVMVDAWMHPLDQELCQRMSQPVLIVNYEKFQWRQNVEQMRWLEQATSDRVIITVK